MRSECDAVLSVSEFVEALDFLSIRSGRGAWLTLRPSPFGLCIQVSERQVEGSTHLAVKGRWGLNIRTPFWRARHVAQSYGDSYLSLLYFEGWLSLNRTRVQAREVRTYTPTWQRIEAAYQSQTPPQPKSDPSKAMRDLFAVPPSRQRRKSTRKDTS